MTPLIPVVQALVYAAMSPLVVGVLHLLQARGQGRRGPGVLQPYRDLRKLFGKRPSVPDAAGDLFLAAPPVVFTCYLLLGYALPTFYVPPPPGFDLLLVVGLLGLATFVSTLAAFDAGAPFGPMSSGRRWYIHVLVEPALLVAVYVLALSRGTTGLALLADPHRAPAALLGEPTIPLAIGTLGYVLLAEVGRLPFDTPDTHLELTMIEEGSTLEYSARALALLRWADAMRVTFGLSMIAFLAVPPVVGAPTLSLLAGNLLAYLLKMVVLVAVLAFWENSRVRHRLRSIATALLMATGVLLFVLATLVVTYGAGTG